MVRLLSFSYKFKKFATYSWLKTTTATCFYVLFRTFMMRPDRGRGGRRGWFTCGGSHVVVVRACAHLYMSKVRFPKFHFNFISSFYVKFAFYYRCRCQWLIDIRTITTKTAHTVCHRFNRNSVNFNVWMRNFLRISCAYVQRLTRTHTHVTCNVQVIVVIAFSRAYSYC